MPSIHEQLLKFSSNLYKDFGTSFTEITLSKALYRQLIYEIDKAQRYDICYVQAIYPVDNIILNSLSGRLTIKEGDK